MPQNNEEILSELDHAFEEFLNYIKAVGQDDFEYAPQGKWDAGQNMLHLLKSARPVIFVLGLPKFFLRFFGKPKRSSRSFTALYNKYKNRPITGKPGPKLFRPEKYSFDKKDLLVEKFDRSHKRFKKVLSKWSENQLDDYILPHPVLGKLTVREMLFFTIFHTFDHLEIVKERVRANKESKAYYKDED